MLDGINKQFEWIKIIIIFKQSLQMELQVPKLPTFHRTKSADNVPGQKLDFKRQMTKESLLANDFSWIIEPKIDKNNRLYGGLALGRFKSVQKEEELSRLNFGAVVSVFKQKNLFIDPKIKHLRVFLSENSPQNFISVFYRTSKFIHSNIAKSNVLVYSQSLHSKTPLIVGAYLIREEKLSAKTAMQIIQKKRRTILVTQPYEQELASFEKDLQPILGIGKNQMCDIM